MTQQAPPAALRSSRPRAGTVKAGNLNPQHAIMELKQRILAALSKLADRDTQQIAVEELDKIVESLSPDCMSVCLSCLYDSEMQQKSVVKKECVRLFGSLASAHGDLIIPHLSKIIGSILRRLRDPDSSVRDACVDAMGILSSRMISLSTSSPTQENGAKSSSSSTSSSGLTLTPFSKPLLDALSEQNKNVQTGAAMCLARVVESARDPPLGAMSRLCSRICKFMSNPNFVARPALLSVIGSLSQIGALGQGQLTVVMPSVLEALENSDWATRKAAAETLGRVSINSGHTLASFRQLTLNNLESCRFDKVKPVRDSVLDAIQLWKSLPEDKRENFGATSKQDSPALNVSMEKEGSQTPSPAASEKSLGAGESPINGNKNDLITDACPARLLKFSSDKLTGILKKKIPLITDKKVNPEFFQKNSARNTDNWDIEVAVPRKCPSPSAGTSQMDAKMIDSEGIPAQILTKGSLSSEEQLFPGREMHNIGIFFNGELEASNKHNDGSPMQRKENFNEVFTFQSLQRQLSQLEQQQSSLLQFVQDFVMSSQETMLALQGRVRILEKVVEELTCNSELPNGWESTEPAAHEMSSGDTRRSELGHFWCNSEPVSNHLNGRVSAAQKVANKASSDLASDNWKDSSGRNSRGRLAELSILSNGPHSQQRSNNEACDLAVLGSEDLVVEQTNARRVWDKMVQSGLERRGEGPSARSVWQASKDEVTLAAIRGAGEEKEGLEVDNLSNEMSRAVHTSDVQSKRQWSLWGSIMEFVLSGDMESAYTEVLSVENAMTLVRLMSRTGPVLDQLTESTANEVLHAVAQLLRQQKYFELCFTWIQQVAEMVMSDGVDFSVDAKKELLLSLQERVATSMVDDSLGASLEQLFQLLMDAWSHNTEVSGTQL